MNLLKLMVCQNECQVLVKVLELDDSLRGTGQIQTCPKDDFTAQSVTCISLTEQTLWLPGTDSCKDNYIAMCTCKSVKAATWLVAKIKRAVHYINTGSVSTPFTPELDWEIVE